MFNFKIEHRRIEYLTFSREPIEPILKPNFRKQISSRNDIKGERFTPPPPPLVKKKKKKLALFRSIFFRGSVYELPK